MFNCITLSDFGEWVKVITPIVAIVISLIVFGIQMRRQRKENQIKLLIDVSERLRSLSKEMETIQKLKDSTNLTEETKNAADKVIGQFNLIGLLFQKKELPRDYFTSMWGRTAQRCYQKLNGYLPSSKVSSDYYKAMVESTCFRALTKQT